ncbi:MAG: lipocalin family protein [Bacteroidota bacterium]
MKTSCIIFVLLPFTGLFPFSQRIVAQDLSKSALTKTWRIEKYHEEGEYYSPEKDETNDYIQFNQDMTFTTLVEGELFKGTWMLNTNGAYIEMKYSTEEIDKLRIKWLGEHSLVVIYDADYYRYTEVHYSSLKP